MFIPVTIVHPIYIGNIQGIVFTANHHCYFLTLVTFNGNYYTPVTIETRISM